jgi:hypothetical protein
MTPIDIALIASQGSMSHHLDLTNPEDRAHIFYLVYTFLEGGQGHKLILEVPAWQTPPATGDGEGAVLMPVAPYEK